MVKRFFFVSAGVLCLLASCTKPDSYYSLGGLHLGMTVQEVETLCSCKLSGVPLKVGEKIIIDTPVPVRGSMRTITATFDESKRIIGLWDVLPTGTQSLEEIEADLIQRYGKPSEEKHPALSWDILIWGNVDVHLEKDPYPPDLFVDFDAKGKCIVAHIYRDGVRGQGRIVIRDGKAFPKSRRRGNALSGVSQSTIDSLVNLLIMDGVSKADTNGATNQ